MLEELEPLFGDPEPSVFPVNSSVQAFSFAFFGATCLLLLLTVLLLLVICFLAYRIQRLKRSSVNEEPNDTEDNKSGGDTRESIPMTELPASDVGGLDDDMYDSVVVPNANKQTNDIAAIPSMVDLPDYDVIVSNEEVKEEKGSSKKFSISVSSIQKSKRESKVQKEDQKGTAKGECQDEYALVNKAVNKEGAYNTLVHCTESLTGSKVSNTAICASKVFPDQYDSFGVSAAAKGNDQRVSYMSMSGGGSKPSSPPPPPLPPPISVNDLPDLPMQGNQVPRGRQVSQYYNTVPMAHFSQVGQTEINEVLLAQSAAAEPETFTRSETVQKREIQEDLYMNVSISNP